MHISVVSAEIFFPQVFDLHTPPVMLFMPYDSTEPAMFAIISHPVGPVVVLMVAYLIHNMQVCRVNAKRVVTNVIDLQAFRDGSVEYAP